MQDITVTVEWLNVETTPPPSYAEFKFIAQLVVVTVEPSHAATV